MSQLMSRSMWTLGQRKLIPHHAFVFDFCFLWRRRKFSSFSEGRSSVMNSSVQSFYCLTHSSFYNAEWFVWFLSFTSTGFPLQNSCCYLRILILLPSRLHNVLCSLDSYLLAKTFRLGGEGVPEEVCCAILWLLYLSESRLCGCGHYSLKYGRRIPRILHSLCASKNWYCMLIPIWILVSVIIWKGEEIIICSNYKQYLTTLYTYLTYISVF